MDEKMMELSDIQISMLKVSPFNVRKTIVEDEEFDANIESLGVLQPIVVRIVDDEYEVVIGQSRLNAAKKAGHATIKCELREMTDEEALIASLSENIARRDISPTDRAIGIAALLGRTKLLEKVGIQPFDRLPILSEPELSKKIGLSQSSIDEYLEPLRLQPKTRELVEEGAIAQKVAAQIRQYADTPQDEEEVAQAFAEVDADKAPLEKHTLDRDSAVAFFKEARSQGLPKDKTIAKLEAKRDTKPIEEPAEDPDEERDDWGEIGYVVIDGHKVTDADLIKRLNTYGIRLAEHAEEMLKCWLDRAGY